jgi:hypothetical protein
MGELQYVKLGRQRKPKGPTARARARKRAKEAPVVKSVRAQCVERDVYCRLSGMGRCEGPSEWCHLGEKKRFKTAGQAPQVRHTTAGSFMGCKRHHGLYDSGVLLVEPFDAELGADGHLRILDTRGIV